VGIDLVNRFIHYCALNANGSIVAEGRVATTPGAIEMRFKTAAPNRIAIEAGMHFLLGRPPAQAIGA
jgi:transposase